MRNEEIALIAHLALYLQSFIHETIFSLAQYVAKSFLSVNPYSIFFNMLRVHVAMLPMLHVASLASWGMGNGFITGRSCKHYAVCAVDFTTHSFIQVPGFGPVRE